MCLHRRLAEAADTVRVTLGAVFWTVALYTQNISKDDIGADAAKREREREEKGSQSVIWRSGRIQQVSVQQRSTTQGCHVGRG